MPPPMLHIIIWAHPPLFLSRLSAYKLSMLCSVDVAVIIFGSPHFYSLPGMDRHPNVASPQRCWGPLCLFQVYCPIWQQDLAKDWQWRFVPPAQPRWPQLPLGQDVLVLQLIHTLSSQVHEAVLWYIFFILVLVIILVTTALFSPATVSCQLQHKKMFPWAIALRLCPPPPLPT
jgi:hypothetical protein